MITVTNSPLCLTGSAGMVITQLKDAAVHHMSWPDHKELDELQTIMHATHHDCARIKAGRVFELDQLCRLSC